MSKTLKTIDLFSGCGGMSQGFKEAGFSFIKAYDFWKPAIEVYNKNFSDHQCVSADLSDHKWHQEIAKSKPDVIIGGPPCQDFSHAGKRDENGGRGSLTLSFAKIISDTQPKWFVMENVDRTLKTKIFQEACELFRKNGYGLTIKVLDASLCGVPQKRKRLFVVGELGSQDNFLLEELESRISEKPITIREYFGNAFGVEHYYRHPRNYERRGVFSIDEPSPTVRGVNRPVPSGYKSHENDTTTDLNNLRPLTTIERSCLQTFPKNFIFEGTKTNLEQMIGNAVPVKLAKFVGDALMRHIKKNANKTSKGNYYKIR
jgi:DNA (cytosine-5)-methyltransferase 1